MLSPREYSILAAIADRVCPQNGDFPAATSILVPERVDALLYRLHPDAQTEFRQVLALIENAAAGVFEGRVRPFTALSADQQDKVLEGWRTSIFGLKRTAFRAVAGLIAGAYWSDVSMYSRVGYPGPPDFSNLPPPRDLRVPRR